MRLICLTALFGFLAVLGLASLRITGPAGLYPQLLVGTVLLLMVPIAFRELRGAGLAVEPELRELTTGTRGERIRMAGIALVWLAYPLLMTRLGFLASTSAMLFVSMILLGSRRYFIVALSSIAFVVAFEIALKTVVYVPVPSAWPDLMLDQAIYDLRR